MLAKIRTSKLFDGKVYAKGSPKSCAVDVKTSLEFELRMGFQDIECNVRQNGLGRYMNDVVIQHHDTIVTSSDLGLAVTCQYDLTNKTVSNEVDLGVTGDIEPALSEEVIVDSPNVVMKITGRDGADTMRSAEVGDPLALRFEILDEQSPYEIFVRELVAMDGSDNAEITLIDAEGCPTDHFIMGPIYKSTISGKILLSHFDAFKFPSSEVVQFRALVTPCMPTCEPVQCDQEDLSGELRSLISYGRKRRSIGNVTGKRSCGIGYRRPPNVFFFCFFELQNREFDVRQRNRVITMICCWCNRFKLQTNSVSRNNRESSQRHQVLVRQCSSLPNQPVSVLTDLVS